jgi:hypothetical protein
MSAKSKAILRIANAAGNEMSPMVKSIAKTLITDSGINPEIMPHEHIITAHLLAEEPIKQATQLALEHLTNLNGPIQENYKRIKVKPSFDVSNKSLAKNDKSNSQLFSKKNKNYFSGYKVPNVLNSSHSRELYGLALKKMGVGIDSKEAYNFIIYK